MSFKYLAWQASIWSVIIPLITGVLFYKYLDKQSRIIFFLVILATIPQVLTFFIPQTKQLDIIYNIYTPIEFAFTYLFIGVYVQTNPFKTISKSLLFLFGVFLFFLLYKVGIKSRFLNELVCMANIFYLIWIFCFILESFISEKKLLDASLPLFWFLVALILYTPCTIITFSLYNYIDKSKNVVIRNLWIISEIFNTVLYVMYGIGLFKNYMQFKNRNR